jgi:Zn-dependent protease with chaperone function
MFRIVLSLLVTALATSAHAETHYYLVDSMAEKSPQPATRAEARELERIYTDLEKASGVEAKLVWSTDPDINAFATEVGGDKIVVVQEGLLAAMDGDRDAVAATLGHELGHHKADHIRAGKRKAEGAHVLGTILGAVVGAKIGKSSGAVIGAAAGSVGGSLVALKFSRDQEMEADRLSVGWMIAAGYNPHGMLRLQRRLGELEGHSHAAIFSTHPTSEKRYRAAEKQIAKLAPPDDLIARPAAPLVGADALAAAGAEIEHAREERIAEALKPEGGPVTAEALAPVGRLGFDAYAAIENELLYAGAKGKAKVLAKNHVTQAQLDQVAHVYDVRMAQNPALWQHYNAVFFRATQGKFAAHGRDLADSYENNQPLHLDPPYPLDDAARVYAELRQRGAPDLDAAQQASAEATVLKPYGMSYYDFLIAHNWWTRKAKIAALEGDSSVLRGYFAVATQTSDDDDDEDADAAPSSAQAANVHVGDNVHVGSNVRAGGKAIATHAADGGH